MAEIVDEVRIDFKTLSVLAKETKEAAKNSAVLQKNFSQLTKDATSLTRVLNSPTGLPAAVRQSQTLRQNLKDTGVAITAIGVAASASFFKMAQLANPAAVERLNRALRDTTAVLGHRLTPYLEIAERGIRNVGDALANAPAPVQEGIGLSLAGGAALVAGAGAIAAGGWVYSQYRGAYVGARGALQAVTARPPVSPPPLPQVSPLQRQLGVPYQTPAGTPPPLPRQPSMAANVAGRVGGALSAGSKYFPLATLPILGLEMSAQESPFGAARVVRQSSSLGMSDWLTRKVTGKTPEQLQRDLEDTRLGRAAMKAWEGRPLQRLKDITGLDLNPFNWFSGNKTSFGAAAQPAEYQDVLGAIMSLRQSVASGAGNDPASQTADNTAKTASLLERMLNSGGIYGAATTLGSSVAEGIGMGGRGTSSR